MKGRKAIPSKIIDLRGGTTHTHKKPRDQEPQPPEKMPSCPQHLDEDAREEWERAGKLLMQVGIMTELDRAMLASYCEAYSRWVNLCNEGKLIDNIESLDNEKQKITQRIKQYRGAYNKWNQALENLQKGIGYIKKDGTPGFSPWLRIETEANSLMTAIRKEIAKDRIDAKKEMKDTAVLLGLSPSSRVGLKVSKPKPQSKAQQFRERKKG